MNKAAAILLAMALLGLPRLPAESSSLPDDERKQLPLTIADCISRALVKNLDITIQRITPQIATANALSTRGIYDPTLNLQTQFGAGEYQIQSNSLVSSETQTISYSGNLTQLTPIGTQVGLSFSSSGTQSNFNYITPEYTSFSGFTLTQPLLRNFGTDITESQIRIARHGQASANAEFEVQVEQIVSNVVSAYYETIYAIDNLASQQKSLDLAQNLLDDNRTRARIGTMTPLDVSQANSEAATRRDAVLQARQTVIEQENALKRLISDDFSGLVGTRIDPVDRPPDDLSGKPIASDMANALRHRPDYREAIERAEQAKFQLVFSQNQTLPQLNLNASYGYAGLGTNLGNSFDNVTTANFPQWYVGLSVQVPFGNRAALGQRDAARLQKTQLLLQIKKLEQDILVQVDNAANRVKTNRERVTISHTATAYAKDALSAEQEKLSAGSSTTYTVLQMQRDLVQAETSELRAIADLRESEVELFRVEGMTLEAYHIDLLSPT